MKFINKTKIEKVEAKVGDFIFANGNLRVIYKESEFEYRAIYVTGEYAFDGEGLSKDTIDEIIEFYRDTCEDFELIKSEEMQLVRI